MDTRISQTKVKQLKTLATQVLEVIQTELTPITVKAGDTLFQKGDKADSYYNVERGLFEISANGIVLGIVGAGEGLGETALLSEQPRTATATALVDTKVLEMSRSAFFAILERQSDLAKMLEDKMVKELQITLLANAFQRIAGSSEVKIIHQLYEEVKWETYKSGDVIFYQDEIGNDMLIIIGGRVRSTYSDGINERVLGDLGSGEIIGELGLLGDSVRIATVKAMRDTVVVRINQDIFDDIINQSPDFARGVMATIVERQKKNVDPNHVEKLRYVTYAIAPIQDQLNMTEFIHQLSPYLHRQGKVFIADQARFDKYFGIKDSIERVPQSLMQQWINELEQMYDFVFFILGDEMTSWTRWVVRNSDRVLLVGEADGCHSPNLFEKSVTEEIVNRRVDLVLLHSPTTQHPSGTAKWLNARSVVQHYHVRMDDGAHMARLARLLTGNGIGWVFGGGGARGYAHIGAMRALMEAQIPADAFGCVSMGAIVGSGALDGMNYGNTYEMVVQKTLTYGSRNKLFDYTIPITALMASKKVSEATRGIAGDMDIEDGWIPFFCVSTNLSRSNLNVHRRGKLHEAVRASLSLPGVYSPVVRNGDLTIDGGVLNNFPVDIMRDFLQGGTIIGMLVERKSASRSYDIDDFVDGIRATLSRLLPWKKRERVPGIMQTIMGASSAASKRQMQEWEHRADFLLKTDTSPHGTLDFDKSGELTEIGYQTHQERALAWADAHRQLIKQPPQWNMTKISSPSPIKIESRPSLYLNFGGESLKVR